MIWRTVTTGTARSFHLDRSDCKIGLIMAQDFVIAQAYWGSTFSPTGSTDPSAEVFSWIDMNAAITTLCRSTYFRELGQYGAGEVIVGGPQVDVVIDDPPAEWFYGFQERGFADGDIIDFIAQQIDAARLPAPTEWVDDELPIYVVFLPRGVSSKDHFEDFVGAHGNFSYGGTSVMFAWIMQLNSLDETTPIVSHEIVEAIGKHLGQKELADDCTTVLGSIDGVHVQGYLSLKDGPKVCVIPTSLTPVEHVVGDLNTSLSRTHTGTHLNSHPGGGAIPHAGR
jgi:hypothetical protein